MADMLAHIANLAAGQQQAHQSLTPGQPWTCPKCGYVTSSWRIEYRSATWWGRAEHLLRECGTCHAVVKLPTKDAPQAGRREA